MDAMRRIDITTNRREYHILHDIDGDPYPEMYGHYHERKPGRRGWIKSLKKSIWQHQVRMYRTWKHTRKTQWKPK
jgi:hypothetical protein